MKDLFVLFPKRNLRDQKEDDHFFSSTALCRSESSYEHKWPQRHSAKNSKHSQRLHRNMRTNEIEKYLRLWIPYLMVYYRLMILIIHILDSNN